MALRPWAVLMVAGALVLGGIVLMAALGTGAPASVAPVCSYGTWSAWTGDAAACTADQGDCRAPAVRTRAPAAASDAACVTERETDASVLLACSQDVYSPTACGAVQCISGAGVETACACGDVTFFHCCPVYPERAYCDQGQVHDCALLCADREETCQPPCIEEA